MNEGTSGGRSPKARILIFWSGGFNATGQTFRNAAERSLQNAQSNGTTLGDTSNHIEFVDFCYKRCSGRKM